MKSRLPLQPQLVFSGSSYYTVEALYGKIASQRDVWDAIKDNSSPSVSAVLYNICKANNALAGHILQIVHTLCSNAV